MTARGTDHFSESDDVPPLSEQQAREQLRYELRDQLGRLTFKTEDVPDEHHRDGIMVALINGEQVDHYLFSTDGEADG